MKVRFWGTRGSIATPGPHTNRFGGNTSCVELRASSGELFIIDCGTGARPLGLELMKSHPKPIHANIMLGHTHWDHIQGFPFFVPAFMPGNSFDVFAPEGGRRSLQETLAGQMEYTYFPVDLSQLPTRITYHELVEGEFEVGGVSVLAQYLNHPAMTLGYRFHADGVTVVYLSDHEPFSETLWRGDSKPGYLASILHEGDRRHASFMAGADLVIHDAQYTPEEYPLKKNWGHSTYEYVVQLASSAGVRRLALTHHEPVHDDDFIADIERRARELAAKLPNPLEVFCAYEGCELEIFADRVADLLMTARPTASAGITAHEARILVVNDNPDISPMTMTALKPEGYILTQAPNGRDAIRLVAEINPHLMVLDLMAPRSNGMEILRMLRSKPETANLPILVITASNDPIATSVGFEVGATDYLTKPFSVPQLRARVRACLARAAAKS